MALFTSPITGDTSGGSARSSLNKHVMSHLCSTLLLLDRSEPMHNEDHEREANPMRKVIVSEFMTLDGVIEDPGGAEGFKHGGWSFHFGGADQQQFKVEELFNADALLLGRRTYQGFAAA